MQISSDLQNLCERGQELLSQTDYVGAERVLMEAERIAWEARNWETLARLYMPLQEARRQKRQIAMDGGILLDFWHDESTPEKIAATGIWAEVLLPGDGNIQPGIRLRRLAMERQLCMEIFLAAGYELGDKRIAVIVALENASLPTKEEIHGIDQLLQRLPPHSLILPEEELAGCDAQLATSLWQRLQLPYLAAADAEADLIRRMAAYRQTILVDNACELAHQKFADTAAGLARLRT